MSDVSEDDDIEAKAVALWVAAADAAVKGGEMPPVGGWDAQSDDLKHYYRTLAGGIERSRQRGT
jgi:hypothetical protein